jgi:lipoyl synthase
MTNSQSPSRQHPEWLKVKFPGGKNYQGLKKLVTRHQLHTVCESAHCPNIGECWEKSTATFMILGNICTRHCAFCAVRSGKPSGYDLEEPTRVAEAVQLLKLQHAVITSVDRDDLPDQGSWVFAETIRQIRQSNPQTSVEILIPDFQGELDPLKTVLGPHPEILAHNLDTVPRLFQSIKPKSSYPRALELLKRAKEINHQQITKTGFMVGLGESRPELVEAMREVVSVKVDILTLGQYLRPSLKHAPLVRHYTPAEFQELKQLGESLGIPHVEAGPLVRSSYHAAEQLDTLIHLS